MWEIVHVRETVAFHEWNLLVFWESCEKSDVLYRAVPWFRNLICSTIPGKVATSVLVWEAGHIRVLHLMQSRAGTQNQGFARWFCLRNKLFTNKSAHETRYHCILPKHTSLIYEEICWMRRWSFHQEAQQGPSSWIVLGVWHKEFSGYFFPNHCNPLKFKTCCLVAVSQSKYTVRRVGCCIPFVNSWVHSNSPRAESHQP